MEQNDPKGNISSGGLTNQQLNALYSLAAGESASSIACNMGITRKTLWRWRQLPKFREELEALTQDLKENMHDRLQAANRKALDILTNALNDNHAFNYHTRIQVAISLLRMMNKSERSAPLPAPGQPSVSMPGTSHDLA